MGDEVVYVAVTLTSQERGCLAVYWRDRAEASYRSKRALRRPLGMLHLLATQQDDTLTLCMRQDEFDEMLQDLEQRATEYAVEDEELARALEMLATELNAEPQEIPVSHGAVCESLVQALRAGAETSSDHFRRLYGVEPNGMRTPPTEFDPTVITRDRAALMAANEVRHARDAEIVRARKPWGVVTISV